MGDWGGDWGGGARGVRDVGIIFVDMYVRGW